MKKNLIFLFSLLFLFWGAAALFYDYFLNRAEIQEEVHTVKIVAWWDIMLSRGIGRWNKKHGYSRTFSWDNYNPLTQFDCYLTWDCVLIFNLESMFSKKDNDEPYWWFLFRSNTWNLQYLLDVKRDNELLLSLANNHTNNAWWDGVKLTREVLSWANIWFFWAWNSEEEAMQIYSIEEDWINLCFQAFSYDWTNWRYYWWLPVSWNPLKFELMQKSLQEMDNLWCEVKIIIPHRWAEYRLHPAQWQRDLAYQLIDAGADIILWGHSHIPWSYEEYQWKPIFYSFGNFIFDKDWWKKPSGWWFDYIYDFELKRRTVPTYVSLLAWFEITKIGTGITISEPTFKMARINKGLYSEIDAETFTGIMSELAF